METYFIKQEDLQHFYDLIAKDYELYVPVKTPAPFKVKCEYGFSLPSDDYLLKRYLQLDKKEIVFNDYRPIEPIRSFFTHLKEEVCEYFDREESQVNEKPLALYGIKNCGLFSLKVQDFVFLGGNEADPLYKRRRENALIISGDCPNFKEACFCRVFDINPYPAEGFDLNFSPLNDGYLVDIDSQKGEEIIKKLKGIIMQASIGQISGRQAKREAVIKRMDEHLSYHQIPKKETLQDIVVSGLESQVWQEQMKTCVECGGCVFICDTCHCFLLADEKSEENAKRLRVWDGCLFKNFSKVAEGANPLNKRYMRLRNRYLKKFDFFIENLGFQACCGCGRCIDVCPGRIDIRYILRKLYEEKHLSAA